MKSYNIDNKILDKDLIKTAIVMACKHKHKKNGKPTNKYLFAQKMLADLDTYTQITYDMLLSYDKIQQFKKQVIIPSKELIQQAFKPTKPVFFQRKCDNGKVRDIASVPIFPDQVIHQILILVSKDIFMKGMYYYSCGSIPKKGIHAGKRYLEKVIQTSNNYSPIDIKYCAQLDISKCYPHIPHDLLKQALKRKFRGYLFLNLCYDIIDSYCEPNTELSPRGLPIGFYTSQQFCNFYLTPLDHFIKEQLQIKYYIRYMDDMTLFCHDKKYLHKAVREIASFLQQLKLPLKSNWQIFRFDYLNRENKHKGRAVDMLGFRFFRDRIILRKRVMRRIKKISLKIRRKIKDKQKISPHDAMSFISRIGWLKHCNSFHFYRKYIKGYIKIKTIKEIIANESRKHNNAK